MYKAGEGTILLDKKALENSCTNMTVRVQLAAKRNRKKHNPKTLRSSHLPKSLPLVLLVFLLQSRSTGNTVLVQAIALNAWSGAISQNGGIGLGRFVL